MDDAKPLEIDLQRDRQLTIRWSDGREGVYPLSLLRTSCPCAACRESRQQQKASTKGRLSILPGNFTGTPSAMKVELVGRYALRLHWQDGHASGIYSFAYLRELMQRDGTAGSSSENGEAAG